MKKYEKPMVVIEDYSVSEYIANNSCEEKVTFKDGQGGCVCYYRGVFPIFTSKEMGCNKSPSNGQYDGICYHGPTGERNFFSS